MCHGQIISSIRLSSSRYIFFYRRPLPHIYFLAVPCSIIFARIQWGTLVQWGGGILPRFRGHLNQNLRHFTPPLEAPIYFSIAPALHVHLVSLCAPHPSTNSVGITIPKGVYIFALIWISRLAFKCCINTAIRSC